MPSSVAIKFIIFLGIQPLVIDPVFEDVNWGTHKRQRNILALTGACIGIGICFYLPWVMNHLAIAIKDSVFWLLALPFFAVGMAVIAVWLGVLIFLVTDKIRA
jgi:hypothetical protein